MYHIYTDTHKPIYIYIHIYILFLQLQPPVETVSLVLVFGTKKKFQIQMIFGALAGNLIYFPVTKHGLLEIHAGFLHPKLGLLSIVALGDQI